MRIGINLLLVLLIGALLYLLVTGISEPIQFRAEKDKRETAVSDRLKDIRTSQEMYRTIFNEYAKDFTALENGLTTGKFEIIKVIGDPDDPSGNFSYDTLYFPAIDSIQTLGIDLSKLGDVPYAKNTKFKMVSDTITYQKTLTHVLEVGVRRDAFMGPYADPKFSKYDDRYDPKSIMKFGSLDAPNLGGNWE